MPKYEHVTGAPCWVDMTSADLASVKPFYTALFGWQYAEMGSEFGGYNIISVGDDVLGGAMQHNPEFMGPDPFSLWSLYFSTEDAAATLKKAEESGGKTFVEPMEIPTQGFMAEGTDSSGVNFGIWQPTGLQGFAKFGEHGFPAWFELHTRDFANASAFYSNVLGAELGANEMGEGMEYHTLDIDGDQKAGIWNVEGVLPDSAPAGWNIYFFSDDVDATIVGAKEHGGTVIMEPEDTEYGRMATVADPAGAVFNIIGESEK